MNTQPRTLSVATPNLNSISEPLDDKPNTDFPGKNYLLVLSLPWAGQRGVTQ